MRVSIITICLNSKETIRKTIESVLNQDFLKTEYIIIDGGSCDGTDNIIKEYTKKHSNITYISERDNGIYDAMNKGIEICTGELIGIINSGDWYENGAISCIVDSYRGNKYEVIYGAQRTLDGDREVECVLKRHENISKQMICHPSCFVTKKIYDDFGTYSTKYKSASDLEFFLRLSKEPDIQYTPVYRILANHSLGGISCTNIGAIEAAKIRYNYGVVRKSKMLEVVILNKMKIAVKNLSLFKH